VLDAPREQRSLYRFNGREAVESRSSSSRRRAPCGSSTT
jgi:hypothetical protein